MRVASLPEHSSWSAEELQAALASEAQAPGGAPVSISPSSGDAAADLAWLVSSPALPVACGSLYLVAALLPLLDPAAAAPVGAGTTD